jgi:hypothetical protein
MSWDNGWISPKAIRCRRRGDVHLRRLDDRQRGSYWPAYRPRVRRLSRPYAVNGTTLTTKVEAAVNPAWVGEEQVRETRFEGENWMFLRPPPREFGGRKVQLELEWVRS